MVEFNTSQSKAIKSLLDAYATLDMNNVEPLLSKNYQYELLPESPDLPVQTREAHLQTWGEVFSSVKKFEVIYHEVIEAPGKVVAHIRCVFSTAFGATINYDNVVTYTLVEEDGELKILRCKIFGDPQQCDAIIAGTVKAAAERVAA